MASIVDIQGMSEIANLYNVVLVDQKTKLLDKTAMKRPIYFYFKFHIKIIFKFYSHSCT
jgi:hypothetical protein